MQVLIGVDGSNGSNAAVGFVTRLLSPERDAISFFYSPPKLDVLFRSRPNPQLTDRLQRFLCEAVFAEAKKQLPGVFSERVRMIVGTQSAAHGLLVAADECRANFIVVGSRGAGKTKDLAIGGIARTVVHQSTLPVLVVRSVAEEAGSRPFRVLLASDGSESCRDAGKLLEDFTWPQEATGRLITVIESPIAGHMPAWLEEQLLEQDANALGFGYFQHQQEQCRQAREQAIRGYDQLPAIFRQSDPVVCVGHACEEIVKTIKTEHIDLVIVGARGLGRVKRLLLGSTSDFLLAHAPCSVLIARQHEKP